MPPPPVSATALWPRCPPGLPAIPPLPRLRRPRVRARVGKDRPRPRTDGPSARRPQATAPRAQRPCLWKRARLIEARARRVPPPARIRRATTAARRETEGAVCPARAPLLLGGFELS